MNNAMNFDFMQQPFQSLASTSTMLMTQATTVQIESLLLISAIMSVYRPTAEEFDAIVPLHNEFMEIAYHSLPVVDDARRLLLKFFEFERQCKKVMSHADERWPVVFVQLQRVKDAIVLLDTVDAESSDESAATGDEEQPK